MTSTMGREAGARQVYFHDPDAPGPTVVVPSAFVTLSVSAMCGLRNFSVSTTPSNAML